MVELSYVEAREKAPGKNKLGEVTKHIAFRQEWTVRCLNGVDVFIQLAGRRHNGQPNRFALKHLMTPSKKAQATSPEDKAAHRLAHRMNPGGNAVSNPFPGEKKADAHSQTRKDKYGEIEPTANTVIDLGLCNLNTVLFHLAKGCLAVTGEWRKTESKDVEIVFPSACVRVSTAKMNDSTGKYDISHAKLSNKLSVSACKTNPNAFEIYHLAGEAAE